MLAEQFTVAADGARTLAQLEEIARLAWRAYGEGHLSDADAQAASEAVEARKARIKGSRPSPLPTPPIARRRPVSPDRQASIERRRRLAASGAVPGRIAAGFTTGETAVLSVIGREVQRAGRCDMPMDKIAALAGVSRSTAQNALREGRRLGLVTVTERRRRGAKSLTNVIEVVSKEWATWLKLGATGYRVQKFLHHEITSLSFMRNQSKIAGKGKAGIAMAGATRHIQT
jgi:hypothetical protein